MSLSRTITVQNLAETERSFDLSVVFAGDSSGVTATVSPSTLTVPAEGKATFDLTLTFDPYSLPLQTTEPFVERSGWVYLAEAGGLQEELVVGFTAIPEVVSAVERTGISVDSDGTARLDFENPGSIYGIVAPFYLTTVDEEEPHLSLRPWADLRYVGVRSVEGETPDGGIGSVLQFAIATHEPWGAAETIQKYIYVDSDLDGLPEYLIAESSLRDFMGASGINLMLSSLTDLEFGYTDLYYYTPTQFWYNAGVSIISIPMDALGISPGAPFGYMVMTHPIGEPNMLDSTPTTVVPGVATAEATYDWSIGDTGTMWWPRTDQRLLLLYADNGPEAAAEVITDFPMAAPAPADNLEIQNGDGSVTLTWDRSTDASVVEYVVARYWVFPNPYDPSDIYHELQEEFLVPQPVGGSQVQFTDTNVENELDYLYAVYARNQEGVRSGLAAMARAHPSGAPARPADFSARAVRYDAQLSWTANAEPDLAGYNIYKPAGDDGWSLLDSVGAGETTWRDRNPDLGRENTYGLTAVDKWGVESEMATLTIRMPRRRSSGGGGGGSPAPAPEEPAPPPVVLPEEPPEVPPEIPPLATPTGLEATAGSERISLSWNPVEGATTYRIYWASGPVEPTTWQELAAVSGTTYAWEDAANGVTYWFRVVAVNDQTSSAASQAVWAMPQDAAAPPGVHENNTEAVTYTGIWATLTAGEGNNQAVSGSHLSSASITFAGTGITWVAGTGPDRGFAFVYLDGVPVAVVDLYQPEPVNGHVAYETRGLSPGVHTLTLVVTGLRRDEATAAHVSVDRFVVHDGAEEQESPAPQEGSDE